MVSVRPGLAFITSIISNRQTDVFAQSGYQDTYREKRKLKNEMMHGGSLCDRPRPCSCSQCTLRIQQRWQELQSLYSLPIYSLPPELILNVIDYVELADISFLIAATYHLLMHHGIVPKLPRKEPSWVRGLLSWPMELINTVPFLPAKRFRCLPPELSLCILTYLRPQDKVNFVLAIYDIPARP